MTDQKTSKYWERFGKFGAVVALFVGVLTIKNYLFPSGPSLTAYCNTISIREYLNHGYSTALKRWEQIEQEKAKQAEDERADQKKRGKRPSPKSDVGEAKGESTIPFSFLRFQMGLGIGEPTQALSCRIVNDGTEPADDVTLHLPSQPVRVLINSQEEKLSNSNAVNLRSVPVGPAMSVEVWLGPLGSLVLLEDRVFVNYKGGKGKVLLAKTHFGLWNTIKENFWGIVTVLGIFLPLLFLVSIVINKQK